MTPQRILSQNLNTILAERKMTQRELERRSNISHSTLQRIMSADKTMPTLNTIGKIASALRITTDELLDGVFNLENHPSKKPTPLEK